MNKEEFDKLVYEINENLKLGFREASKVNDAINGAHNIVYLIGVRRALELTCQALDHIIESDRSEPGKSQFHDLVEMIAKEIFCCESYFYKKEKKEDAQ